jgi:hypothetical protein
MTTALLLDTASPAARPPVVTVGATRTLRTTSMLVGSLFLIATATFATGNALVAGVLSEPAYLTVVTAHTGALSIGALLAFVQGVAIVLIAVLLFPLLKQHGESLALAYVGFRVAELAATLFYVATPLLAIQLGSTLPGGPAEASSARPLEALLTSQHSVAIVLIYLVTGVNGTILSGLLLRSGLVPRSLAILGLVGYPVLFAGAVLAISQVVDVTHGVGLLALVPGGIYELLLPLWLIKRGLGATAVRRGQVR